MRGLRSVLVIALLVGLSSPAHAKRAPGAKKRAQEHYAAGVRAYNVGEFDRAISEWKTGYKLHGSPFFLFNIAQAYRGTRDYSQAIFFFNAYLREKPDASNADEVTTLRDEMERLLKEEDNNKRMRPKEPIAPDTVDIIEDSELTPEDTSVPVAATSTSSTGDDQRSGGGSLKTVGLITGGTGLALIATGIGFAAAASSAQSELEQASRDLEPWNQRLQDLETSGSRNAALATGLTIAGAAAVVGGVGVYYFGIKKDQEAKQSRVSVTLIPALGPTQAGATLRVAF